MMHKKLKGIIDNLDKINPEIREHPLAYLKEIKCAFKSQYYKDIKDPYEGSCGCFGIKEKAPACPCMMKSLTFDLVFAGLMLEAYPQYIMSDLLEQYDLPPLDI